MISPADTAGQLLEAAGVVKGASGFEVKIGKQTSTPDNLVAMYDTGGQTPNPKWAVDFVTIQALVRTGPNEYKEAWEHARKVKDALLGLESVTIDGDRWVSITMAGDIGFIGYDDKERPTFSANFRIIMEPAVTGNREAL